MADSADSFVLEVLATAVFERASAGRLHNPGTVSNGVISSLKRLQIALKFKNEHRRGLFGAIYKCDGIIFKKWKMGLHKIAIEKCRGCLSHKRNMLISHHFF